MDSRNVNDFDKDINPILGIASNDELDFLVTLITDTFTNTLWQEDAYKKHCPNHVEYADIIAHHLRQFGGNSFANAYRCLNVEGAAGIGPKYHEIVRDVAKKLKANFNKSQPVEKIEDAIISTVLENTLNKMSDEEKKEFLKSLGITNFTGTGPSITAAAIAAFRAGGFKSYQLAVTVVNSVLKALIGRGLPFVGGPILTQSLKFLTGPAGWILTGAWALMDVASPAMRITIPAVLYIAILRIKYNTNSCTECGAQLQNEAKFCSECGFKVGGSTERVQSDWVGTEEGIVSARQDSASVLQIGSIGGLAGWLAK